MVMEQAKVNRLKSAVTGSYDRLKTYRNNRMYALQQYAGRNYGSNGASDKVPVNLLETAVSIYVQQLAPRAPRALVTTKHSILKSQAVMLETALNRVIDEIDLGKQLKRLVRDALFSVGIARVGIQARKVVEIDGKGFISGPPSVDVIDLEDFVIDMSARRYEEAAFIGDKYRLPLEWVKTCGLFDEKAVKTLKSEKDQGEQTSSDPKAADLYDKKTRPNDDIYEDFVELWDIYLPFEGKIVTIGGGDDTPVLRETDWDGPASGPYVMLAFSEMPSNVFPVPPVAHWVDMHTLLNAIFRKLGRQAERQKTITVVRSGNSKDGQRVVEANDGETVLSDDPNATKEVRYGGIDSASLAFMLQCKDLFSYNAGNLDALGGLSPMSNTARQDELLSNNASKRVQEMQARTTEFSGKLMELIAWYLWYDPLISIPLTYRIPYLNIDMPVDFTPEDRRGDFLAYNVRIQPYSMQDATPQARLQAMTQVLQTYIIPFGEALMQQGVMPNFDGILKTVARYLDMDELEDILTMAKPSESKPVGSPGPKFSPMKPAVTKRIVERVSRPGASRNGKDQIMAMALTGQNPQPKEMAAMTRPVG